MILQVRQMKEAGEKMPENEKTIIEKTTEVLMRLKPEDMAYVLGYAEGVAAVKGTEPGDKENQEEVLV